MGVPSQGTLTQFTNNHDGDLFIYIFSPNLQAQSYIITFFQVDDGLPSPSFHISKSLSLSLYIYIYVCVYIYTVYKWFVFSPENNQGNKIAINVL